MLGMHHLQRNFKLILRINLGIHFKNIRISTGDMNELIHVYNMFVQYDPQQNYKIKPNN